MDDTLADFGVNGHMNICNIVRFGSMVCNRDCAARLYSVALALAGNIVDSVIVTPLEAPQAPECEGHREQQHCDSKGPWCSRCGWTHGQPAIPAEKRGASITERDSTAEHRPWSPHTGYEPVCLCDHTKARHEDTALAPDCMDCGCAGFVIVTE